MLHFLSLDRVSVTSHKLFQPLIAQLLRHTKYSNPNEQSQRIDKLHWTHKTVGYNAALVFVCYKEMDLHITKLDLCGRFAITVDQVLTSTECHELIDLAEESGAFQSATINDAGQKIECKEIRDCLRWINDDPVLAEKLFRKVREYLPAKGGRVLPQNTLD